MTAEMLAPDDVLHDVIDLRVKPVGATPEEEALWGRYWGGLTDETELVSWYHRLAMSVVAKFNTTDYQEYRDDLRASALLGLLLAIRGYDPSRGITFPSYATSRIRHVMIDEIRRTYGGSRVMMSRQKQIHASTERLRQILMREPTVAEVIQHCDMTYNQYIAVLDYTHCRGPLHYEFRAHEDSEEIEDGMKSTSAFGISDTYPYEGEEESLLLASVTMCYLNSKEYIVITEWFGHSTTLKEIGEMIGVSEARASQIRKEALRKIREGLRSEGMDEYNFSHLLHR